MVLNESLRNLGLLLATVGGVRQLVPPLRKQATVQCKDRAAMAVLMVDATRLPTMVLLDS